MYSTQGGYNDRGTVTSVMILFYFDVKCTNPSHVRSVHVQPELNREGGAAVVQW